MRHIKIKILTILLLSTIWSFGQLTQAYKNGFVAATSDGIYYLMDGDNQWVNLTDYPTYGVSYGGKIWSNEYVPSDEIMYFRNIFGYKDRTDRMYIGLNPSKFNKKNVASKLKYDDFMLSIYNENGTGRWIAVNKDYTDPDHFIFGSTPLAAFNNFTSMATDNDSTVVVVGSDNILEKKYFSKYDNSYEWINVTGLNSGVSGNYDCPDGYSDLGTGCQLVETSSPEPPSNPQYLVNKNNNYYSTWGTVIFTSFNVDGTGSYSLISSSNSWWKNIASNYTDGPLNRCAVWTEFQESGQDIGFPITINVQESKTYYVGFGCDNYGIVKVNGTTIIQQDLTALNEMWNTSGDATGFRYWYIYPIQLNAGLNVLEVYGHNIEYDAAVGVEVYDNTSAEIASATSYSELNLVFSTKDYVGQPVYLGTGGVGYTCPAGYQLSVVDNVPTCVKMTTIPYDCVTLPSGHQITYNPTDDLFYIVSDEGYVYTYDKSTVTKIKEIGAYCDGGCDSVTDIAYSPQDSILYIGVVNGAGEKQTTLLYLNSANNGTVNQINYTSTADIQMTTNSAGKVLFNINNEFYLYGKTNAKTLPSLPSGVTVYDLDYIDYLPFIDTGATPPSDAITYEGIMTVGGIEDYTGPETGYTVSFYGWIVTPESFNFGSISPELETTADNIIIFFVISETFNLGVIGLESSLGGISVAPFSQTTEIIDFEIGGVDYTLTKTDYGEGYFQWDYQTLTNPFPAIGETCTVKIIYTP